MIKYAASLVNPILFPTPLSLIPFLLASSSIPLSLGLGAEKATVLHPLSFVITLGEVALSHSSYL